MGAVRAAKEMTRARAKTGFSRRARKGRTVNELREPFETCLHDDKNGYSDKKQHKPTQAKTAGEGTHGECVSSFPFQLLIFNYTRSTKSRRTTFSDQSSRASCQ
jgi:hypothetical protein